jgi:hypothetical protein
MGEQVHVPNLERSFQHHIESRFVVVGKVLVLGQGLNFVYLVQQKA